MKNLFRRPLWSLHIRLRGRPTLRRRLIGVDSSTAMQIEQELHRAVAAPGTDEVRGQS